MELCFSPPLGLGPGPHVQQMDLQTRDGVDQHVVRQLLAMRSSASVVKSKSKRDPVPSEALGQVRSSCIDLYLSKVACFVPIILEQGRVVVN